MLSKKNKLLVVFSLTLFFGGAGIAGWQLWQTPPAPGRPVALSGKQKSMQAEKPGKRLEVSDSPVPDRQNPPQAVQTPQSVPASVPVSGSLAELTMLRAKLHNLDAQVAIAEKQARLAKLEAPEPVLVAQPPSLPATSLPLSLPPLEREEKSLRSREAVVSVQGVNGELSATIRTRSGSLVTVRQGGRYAGGIAQIGRSQVAIRTGRTTTLLPFE